MLTTAATLHSIWTVLVFIYMLAIIVWAYSSKQKASFDEAANLVFADDEQERIEEDKR